MTKFVYKFLPKFIKVSLNLKWNRTKPTKILEQKFKNLKN